MLVENAMLPFLYARWVDEFLGAQPPDEANATCANCAMCAPDAPAHERSLYFRPDVKCCSYVPDLPNFLAGAILEDETPEMAEGRQTLCARLATKDDGITPLGVHDSAAGRFQYDQLTRRAGFGRESGLLCPHFRANEGGRCTIWKYRNGVCATWFCKHVRGQVGEQFWQRLNQLFAEVERELALWCLAELFIPAQSALALVSSGKRRATRSNPANTERASGTSAYDRLWGEWAGREQELYRRCATFVGSLSWREVTATCGPSVRLIERAVRECHGRLTSHAMSDRLRLAPFQILGFQGAHVRVVGYSMNDPVQIPQALLDVLRYFDGRSSSDALAVIERECHVRVHEGLVRRLVDFGLLVEA